MFGDWPIDSGTSTLAVVNESQGGAVLAFLRKVFPQTGPMESLNGNGCTAGEQRLCVRISYICTETDGSRRT